MVGMPRISCFLRGAAPCIIMINMLTMLIIIMLILLMTMLIMLTIQLIFSIVRTMLNKTKIPCV